MAGKGKPFQKGNTAAANRGPNKITRTVKETVLAVFNDLQEDPKANLLKWGTDNPTEFYKIAAKLIPTELNASVEVIKPNLPDWMKSNEGQS